MYIYFLFLVVCIFFWLSFLVGKDLFSPSCMICLSYILAILCAIYNINNWNINLNENTFWIIFLGLLCFLLTSLVVGSLQQKYHKKEKINLEYINLDKNLIFLLNIFSLIIFIIYTNFFLKAIGKFSNFEQFSKAMTLYRLKLPNQSGDEEFIPTIINFLSKFCRALAYIYIYIIINNFLVCLQNKRKIEFKKYRGYFIGILIYIPLTFMGGARFNFIIFFIATFIIWWCLSEKISKKNISIKSIIKMFLILYLVLVFFSVSRTWVGRTNKSSTIDYITQYFGGSIQIFDMYMQEKHEFNGVIGQELFSDIRKFLTQIHLIQVNPNSDLGKFRVVSGNFVLGNVYTAFRKMYHDFGFLGVIVFQSILSIVFNTLYCKIKYSKNLKIISFELLIYSTISYCLLLHSYSEFFFSTILSFNYISLFIMMYIIRLVIIKYKIKF